MQELAVTDLRQLLDETRWSDAVLYVEMDEDTGAPSYFDTWVPAYVQSRQIVISRSELIDWMSEGVSDDRLEEICLPELQRKVENVLGRFIRPAEAGE